MTALHPAVSKVGMGWGAAVACALPFLWAFTTPPSATFFNQVLALGGWGAWVGGWALCTQKLPTAKSLPQGWAGVGCLWWVGLLLVASVVGGCARGLPVGMALSTGGVLAGAGLALFFAHCVVRQGYEQQAFTALCVAVVAAGVLNTVVAVIQVAAPHWIDGEWMAHTSAAITGRGAGNIRQPNHLSSLLLWAGVALVALHPPTVTTLQRNFLSVVLACVLCFGLVLTGSRTGVLGLVLLALWGAGDRRLRGPLRCALVAAPLVYACIGWAVVAWGPVAVGVENRLSMAGDVSSSRFAVWSNAWQLLLQHPWLGVGWGGFNGAWTLTPFPLRPVAFFDHAHNLPLHWAVELGLPLALLLCGLLLVAYGRGLVCAFQPGHKQVVLHTPAMMMVTIMAVHSLLEYPLWYAYFLLPTCFVWGLSVADSVSSQRPGWWLGWRGERTLAMVAGFVLIAGCMFALWDYRKVSVIFAPPAGTAPLAQRIQAGQGSVFFSHHAYYAHATTHPKPREVIGSIKRAARNLIDPRLLKVWLQAYAALGDFDRAQHLAQRLREFKPDDEFFASCKYALAAPGKAPYQCVPPSKILTPAAFLGEGACGQGC